MTNEQSPPSSSAEDQHRAAMRAAARRIDRINDWLCVGGAVPVAEYARFGEKGITHVVDLREDAEVDADPARLAELGIAWCQIPVPNHGAPTTAQLDELAKWFDAKKADGKVYVHCGGGFGRAATMAVGLLILTGSTLDDAVAEVRKARPEIRLNADQLAWLGTVEGPLLGKEHK